MNIKLLLVCIITILLNIGCNKWQEGRFIESKSKYVMPWENEILYKKLNYALHHEVDRNDESNLFEICQTDYDNDSINEIILALNPISMKPGGIYIFKVYTNKNYKLIKSYRDIKPFDGLRGVGVSSHFTNYTINGKKYFRMSTCATTHNRTQNYLLFYNNRFILELFETYSGAPWYVGHQYHDICDVEQDGNMNIIISDEIRTRYRPYPYIYNIYSYKNDKIVNDNNRHKSFFRLNLMYINEWKNNNIAEDDNEEVKCINDEISRIKNIINKAAEQAGGADK